MKAFSRLWSAPSHLASLRRGAPRMVPAAMMANSELIHLGGGEMIPCPGVETLPLAASARHLGLGSPSLALPPCKVHVLHDAVLLPGARIVQDSQGRTVSESLTAEMVGRSLPNEVAHRGAPVEMSGTVALFRSPFPRPLDTLIDHLPRAALLAQPAVRRSGPITLVHDGPLNELEELLLGRLIGNRLELREVDPARPIRADRVLLPCYVTRPGAGAIPSWYRRWVDRAAASIDAAASADQVDVGGSGARRFFVEGVQDDATVANRAELDRVLDAHGFESVDISALSAAEQVRRFRNAEVVVGVAGNGLANTVFSRAARVVELARGQELSPWMFYLCASKGLPYDYVLAPAEHPHAVRERRWDRTVAVDVGALDRLLTRLA